jgi:hypothetical protein
VLGFLVKKGSAYCANVCGANKTTAFWKRRNNRITNPTWIKQLIISTLYNKKFIEVLQFFFQIKKKLLSYSAFKKGQERPFSP